MDTPRLGIIGGMGPQASQMFYQMILDRTEASCDQEHLSTLILSDTEMPDRTQAILSGNEDVVRQRLIADGKMLARCGCTVFAVPCNTSHYFAPDLCQQVDIPLIQMPEETAKYLAEQKVKRVGLLATDGTVHTKIYQQACQKYGIEVVTPDFATQALVVDIIFNEIKRGEKGSREKFAAIDRAIRQLGCQRVILGCTELSVYRIYHGLPPFYVDAMEILADACILACGKQRRLV